MKISHYFEFGDTITGGQKQSVKNQRKILEKKGLEYSEEFEKDADILHLNLMGPRSVYYAWKAKRNDIPVVVHAHQTAEDFEESFAFSNLLARPMKPYLEWAYDFADHIICPSEHNREVMESYTDTPKTVLSNGFDSDKLDGFEELREEYLEKYDLEPPVVFCVGGEGFLDRFIRSNETQKLVENSPENCTFTGFIDDVRGAFAAGDIFFFPTKNENEGMALLEAMSCGKPPVVRDIETFEWLKHDKNCLKASEDFKPVLEELIEDEEKRESVGGSAKEKSQEFRLEKVGKGLLEVYIELV